MCALYTCHVLAVTISIHRDSSCKMGIMIVIPPFLPCGTIWRKISSEILRIFPSIIVFSSESTLRMRWPKYWSSVSALVLPMSTQDWSPVGWTDWISLQSKGLSRVFSNTTVQKHQFFSAQLSSLSNSYIHTWPLEKPQTDAKAETPMLWPPHAKSWLIGKDSDAGRD